MGRPYDRQHDRASPSECCGRKKGDGDEALGRSQGGFGTKIHLKCDGAGRPIAFRLSAGQRHKMTIFEELLDAGKVKRASRGRPEVRARFVLADRAYSGRKRIGAVSPERCAWSCLPNGITSDPGHIAGVAIGNGMSSNALYLTSCLQAAPGA
ncbi:transposase [Deinococcus arenae]|uniref:transposase n=1 Tax=Deinococcus arenae TaxID=1452751 RepID=UPI000D7D31D3|nr:hypothetical protein DM785_12185 [Deinococcus actinosclerus]